MSTEELKRQITDSAGNVHFTFVAHWIIVNRLQFRLKIIKYSQILLTALSTGGFLSLAFAAHPRLMWIGGLSSGLSLAINLYLLHFDVPENIRYHTNAANELWEIREAYKSLLVDFDDLDIEQIRSKRDCLTARVSEINKKYSGTDKKSFSQAQKALSNYVFADREAAQLLHLDRK